MGAWRWCRRTCARSSLRISTRRPGLYLGVEAVSSASAHFVAAGEPKQNLVSLLKADITGHLSKMLFVHARRAERKVDRHAARDKAIDLLELRFQKRLPEELEPG